MSAVRSDSDTVVNGFSGSRALTPDAVRSTQTRSFTSFSPFAAAHSLNAASVAESDTGIPCRAARRMSDPLRTHRLGDTVSSSSVGTRVITRSRSMSSNTAWTLAPNGSQLG